MRPTISVVSVGAILLRCHVREKMMSDRLMTALRALIKGRSSDSASEALIKLAARDESPSHDRALALVGIVYLEDALRSAISKHFAPTRPSSIDGLLFEDEQAPLGTLAARTRLAAALGIISDQQRQDLNVIRVIRNVFGHSSESVSFGKKEIQEALSSLNLYKVTDFAQAHEKLSAALVGRVKFTVVIVGYCAILEGHRGKWVEPLPPEQEALVNALRDTPPSPSRLGQEKPSGSG
jgi:DNA-binding MltR family transcriptional regulator